MGGDCPVEAKLLANVVIDVPPESQVHNQLVRKEADGRAIEMDPVVRLCFVEVREPDMHELSGDLRRLMEALEEQWPDRVGGDIVCDLKCYSAVTDGSASRQMACNGGAS